jgi:uncharacterized membrane protein (Fun14 family)
MSSNDPSENASSKAASSPRQGPRSPRSPRGPRGKWTRLCLTLSIALMVAGGGLMGYAAIRGEPEAAAPVGPTPAGGLALGLMPNDPNAPAGEPAPATGDALDAWSPTIFRLGFSFFAGFSIAYAARTFFKISVLAAGVALLGLFGLQYAGVIDVNWNAMSDHWDAIAGWLSEQTASFGEFIRGYLPSAGMAGMGLVMGFRRR